MMNDQTTHQSTGQNPSTYQGLQVDWRCDDMTDWERGNTLMRDLATRFDLIDEGAGTGFGRRDVDYLVPYGEQASRTGELIEALKLIDLPDFQYNFRDWDEDDEEEDDEDEDEPLPGDCPCCDWAYNGLDH